MPNKKLRVIIGFRRLSSFILGPRALRYSALTLIISTLLCAWVYMHLTPSGDGVKIGNDIPQDFGFLEGLYFSIVTTSSLGYGDIRPVGVSRILATVQVILGLSLIGIIIAVLTSRRISHRIGRLSASDIRKQLAELSGNFDNIEVNFSQILNDITQAYGIPGELPGNDPNSQEIPSNFQRQSTALSEVSETTYSYFQEESVGGNFIDLAPDVSLKKFLNSVYSTLNSLSRCLVQLPHRNENPVFIDILREEDQKNILDSINNIIKTCEIGVSYSSDRRIKKSFKHIDEICKNVSKYTLEVSKDDMPDQVIYVSSDLRSER